MRFPMTAGVAAVVTAALLPFLATGCTPDPGTGGTGAAGERLSGMVTIDGSSTVYPITEAVAEEFMKAHPGVRVTVGISGTGGGFQKFGSGETQISNASRPIAQVETERCARNGIEFIELPIAYDALTVVVHPENTWAETITVAELKKIWEPEAQGRITNWNQVRPGWPDLPLRLFAPGADSGTFDYFTEAICGKSGASRGDFTASEDDNILVQGVARSHGGLGYFGMSYYVENPDRLKAVRVDGGGGPVAPSLETVMDGSYQPLSRPIFIYVRRDAAERPELRAFVEFYLQHVPQLSQEVGYVPLSSEVYTAARERFGQRRTGSIFAGGPQIGVNLADLVGR